MTNTPTQSQPDVEGLGRVQGPRPMTVPTPTEAEAMSARLEIEAEGWRQSAENQARDHGEGTEDQEFMEETAALFDEAAAFIRSAATALRTSDEARKADRKIFDEQVTRAENQWKQWEARAEAAEARVKALDGSLRQCRDYIRSPLSMSREEDERLIRNEIVRRADVALSSAPAREDALAKAVGERD